MSHPELLQSIIAGDRVAPDDCPVRDILDRIGDKWSLLVLHLLSLRLLVDFVVVRLRKI